MVMMMPTTTKMSQCLFVWLAQRCNGYVDDDDDGDDNDGDGDDDDDDDDDVIWECLANSKTFRLKTHEGRMTVQGKGICFFAIPFKK